MSRKLTGGCIAITLSAILVVPAVAQAADLTVVVESGLDAPRGLAFGSDGTLYVAEAGAGGDAACADNVELGEMCFAPTGSIVSLKP